MHRRNPHANYFRCSECGISFPNPRRDPEKYRQMEPSAPKPDKPANPEAPPEENENEEYTTLLDKWRRRLKGGE